MSASAQNTAPTAAAAPEEILDAEVVDDAEPQPEPAKPSVRARLSTRAHTAVTGWWGYTAQPMGVREAWVRSGAIDPRRIPGESTVLFWFWWWSNRTDRVLLFCLLGILPTWANGPLLWIAVRPTRRWGLYLVTALVLFIVPAIARG